MSATVTSVLAPWIDALKGEHGTIGLFSAFQQAFIAFGIIGGTASWFIDAPFGRYGQKLSLRVNGNLGWFLMELVSPLSFLVALCTPLSASPITLSIPSAASLASHSVNWSSLTVHTKFAPFAAVTQAFASLTPARRLLAFLFIAHYANRSILSSLRNPGRAPMHIAVPLAAALFNVLNGFLQGTYVAGGLVGNGNGKGWSLRWGGANWASSWGVQEGILPASAFWLGLVLFVAGLAGNIYCDEVLYSIKRSKRAKERAGATHVRRYSIPHSLFLYDFPLGGISQPSYTTEWVEWLGFCLIHASLIPGPFPVAAAASSATILSKLRPKRAHVASLVKSVPKAVRPLTHWFAQPPILFLINEIAMMLPRAVSSHAWYAKTFDKEWPKERKVVIPGVF